MASEIKALVAEKAGTTLSPLTISRRELMPDDVQFDVLYCGICHSDLHQMQNDFGMSQYPMVPGHEIVGKVTAIGSDVTKFKVGDLAAVGCIVDSCGSCALCDGKLEQFCEQGVTFSFNSADKYSGGQTFGGFSKSYVCKEAYTLKMPESLDLAAAAPLLCAGITVYSPLRHWNAGKGKKVGVVGLGGLGHMAIKMAKAMGAEVIVFTTSQNKAADAKRLGAHDAVVSTDKVKMAEYASKVDLIIDTVSAKHDVNEYLNLLAIDGSVVLVGLPPEPLEIGAFNIVMGRRSFSGSNIGGIAETQEMLGFCDKHNITADIELIKASEVNQAFERLAKGDVKYRFVIDMSTLS